MTPRARSLATSPAWCPPMPSATAKILPASSTASSFISRTLPVSVSEADAMLYNFVTAPPWRSASRTEKPDLDTTSSRPELKHSLANLYPVPLPQLQGIGNLTSVNICSVSGSKVLHVKRPIAVKDARVLLRGVRVVYHDVAIAGPADMDVIDQVVLRPDVPVRGDDHKVGHVFLLAARRPGRDLRRADIPVDGSHHKHQEKEKQADEHVPQGDKYYI